MNAWRNPQEIKYFAKTNFRNSNEVFGIRDEDMQYHCAIIGKTGSGKTNVLKSFILNDLQNGRNFCLIDPHGDLLEFAYKNVPKHRRKDLVYLDVPNPDLKVGYNPIKKVSKEKRSLVVSSILEIFERLAGPNGWGHKLAHVLRHCLLAICDYPKQLNFSHVLSVLRDKEFRKEVVRHIQNKEVKGFFIKEFKEYNPKYDFVPVYSKLSFLAHPAIRRLLVENEDAVSLRKVMDSQILLVNLPMGAIGLDSTTLLGSLIISSLASAGFSRIDTKEEERVPFTVYIDEASTFVNTTNIASMLEGLRKMKVRCCLAFQHLSQLDTKLKDSLFSNVGNVISFRTSASDAEYLVKEMHIDDHRMTPFSFGDFVRMEQYHIIVKMMINGQPCKPFTAVTIDYQDYL